MKAQSVQSGWTERFAGLAALGKSVRSRLERDGQFVRVAKGKTLFARGQSPNRLFFLLEGRLRVARRPAEGREITLFQVEAGQSCVMTTACILDEESEDAVGIAETDLFTISLPRASFDLLMSESAEFRNFVLKAYARRVTDLIRKLNDVADRRLGVRLAARLLELAQADEVRVTHAALAIDLVSARTAISREMAKLQAQGMISQGRGRVHLLDCPALEALAAN